MAQRDRRAARAKVVTARAVFEPSRVAGEVLARAYAVAVPMARRRLPTAGALDPPASPRVTMGQREGGAAR